jgi:hypothetical protein
MNHTEPPQSSEVGQKKNLLQYLYLTLIFFIWCLSFFLITQSHPAPIGDIGDIATLLFGAVSIALFLFSLLIGVLAIFGFQAIERYIRERVGISVTAAEIATNKKLKTLEYELRGRVDSALGYMLGEMGLEPGALTPEDPERLGRLEEAVAHCKQGYELLKEVGGPAEFTGLNNLIFYSCVYGKGVNRDFLLARARDLRREAQKHVGQGASNVILTACRAILQYGSDAQEIRDARATLTALISPANSILPERLKKEAKLYLDKFPEQPTAKQPDSGTR